MLERDNAINKELNAFLNDVTKKRLPVYNIDMLDQAPPVENRIEYSFTNVRSTGSTKRDPDRDYSEANYNCQLTIDVISTPVEASELATDICGGINTFSYLDTFMRYLYMIDETLSVDTFRFKNNGVIRVIKRIKIRCNFTLEHTAKRSGLNYTSSIKTVMFDVKVK